MRTEVLGWMRDQCVGGFAEAQRLEHGWAFSLGSCGVMVSTTWRIIANDQVALSSTDDGHPFGLGRPMDVEGEANAIFRAQTISEVVVDRSTGDLLVEFSGRQRLQILSTSAGYENWIASFAANGLSIDVICGGAGALSVVKQPVGANAPIVVGEPLT